jgi:hypothetical protein
VALNSVKIHFKTKDILLPGLWVSHPLGTDHSHDFSNDSAYGQNVFTTVIRLRVALISGGGTPVDLTTLLGGPWAGGANVHIDEEADITEILRQAVGGIKQKHVLSFTCDIGQGILECAVKLSMTVQSVIVG